MQPDTPALLWDDHRAAALIPDLRRIVAFRNVFVHGYAVVDDAIVWDVATTRIEPLIETLNRLLRENAQ